MQSTSWETLGWMKHKLESRLPGEISITSDMQMTPPYGRKWRTKEPLDESERGEWKSWLKAQHSETKIMASGPITSWQIDGTQWKQWLTLILGAPKSLQMVTAAIKLKDAWVFPGGSDGKASACNAGDLGLIPGLGRYSGEGNGNPLQYSCLYSCLENPTDGGAW